jgi:hypothetical protein
MKYIDQSNLDLELRLNYELKNNSNPNFLSLEIDNQNKIYLEQILFDKNIEITLKNITSIALKRYLKRYKRRYHQNPKYLILATYITQYDTIVLHGIIFSKNIHRLKSNWTFSEKENQEKISPIESKPSFVTFFVKKYINSKNKIYTYSSKNFGTDAYKGKLANILKTYQIDLLPEEHFEQIPFFNGYFISKSGIVISRKREPSKVLKTYIYNNQTYVMLYQYHRAKKYRVSHLMAKTYMGLEKVTTLYKVIHLNHNTSDNNLSNLMLMTSI